MIVWIKDKLDQIIIILHKYYANNIAVVKCD